MPATAASTFPEYLTPAQVARILGVHTKTIIRRFQNIAGVLDLGTKRHPTKRGKREKYSILRIPHDALKRFMAEHRVAGGGI
jgi:hypothetical protein